MEDRRTLFNAWATHYDASVGDGASFPFMGYRDTLATTLNVADPGPGQLVLDVGSGTGNLSLLFSLAGCEVTGLDFSGVILEIARQRIPGARFLELDLLGSWDPIAGQQFDFITSAYVFHELDLETRLDIIGRLVEEHLQPGGRVVVADISFTTRADLDAAHAEFYWSAEVAVAALRERKLTVSYIPVPPSLVFMSCRQRA